MVSVNEGKDCRSVGIQTERTMISIPLVEKKKEVKFDLGKGPSIKEKLRKLPSNSRKRAEKARRKPREETSTGCTADDTTIDSG